LLLISPEHRGLGLGRAAYEALENEILGWKTCRRIRLAVIKTFPSPISFWHKMGFVETGEVKPYRYADLESESVMFEKVLAIAE
jgi:GNAT superfamily N-acetyltransferase